jgi:hypothetical protein
MLEFFDFENFFSLKFCLPGLRKKIFGQRKAGMKNFFFGKITHVFGDTPRVGNTFLKDFFDFEFF